MFGEWHPNKVKYPTFTEFYPFYLTQHSNDMCQKLHFLGTTITMILFVTDFTFFMATTPALMVGMSLRLVTKSMSHGFVEFIPMLIMSMILQKALSNSYKKGLYLALIGYFFAWVGHFVYEKNVPATFTYPLFSLAGDIRMWFGLLQKYTGVTLMAGTALH